MDNSVISELKNGFSTAYIDSSFGSSVALKPEFLSNDYKSGKKVLSSIEDELVRCDRFQISVAFITMGGITPLLQVLQELEKKGIPGQILTTNYLNFSEPEALKRLNSLSNITLKMFDAETSGEGFHTKGYIFHSDELYRIIIGSSNMTSSALTINREWNTKIISTEKGEVCQQILSEFEELWNSDYSRSFDEFFEEYQLRYKVIKEQRKIAVSENPTSLYKYNLKPNSMQVGFINNLQSILDSGHEKALLISATGTGKTYASAFAMRQLGFKKVLFLVHRGQLAKQTKKSYELVFDKRISMGIVGAGYDDYDKDYIFAMVQTLSKDDNLTRFSPDHFDCIIFDEAHHSTADTYQKIMNYFKPKFWLGMTATPDKRDDNVSGNNVYELFDYQIAYEIRLQQAMEEDLLCPFHYFGITDLSIEKCDEKSIDFNMLVSDERVKHIINQAEYFGYSGDRVKGLVFCSKIKESEELSEKFNALGYRTIALNGSASEAEREVAFERLAMDENPGSPVQSLDYIFSVEILNEGVDIVEVNQVIMLRPTQSPIVFIQQLGRGLRKANNKEYVVILDFIGNYTNNFMIPVALSGDRTYNADTIRKYVISGNNTIPGASTVHFDEIAKDKIFSSIDRIKGLRTIIKDSYVTLRNRLGREPLLIDFYEHDEIDPTVIIKEYKTYWQFMEAAEKTKYISGLTEHEKNVLEYLSKTVLCGVRPNELYILRELLTNDRFNANDINNAIKNDYDYQISSNELAESIKVLQGHFVSNNDEYLKYKDIDILTVDEAGTINRLISYCNCLHHNEFYTQVKDIIDVGLARYQDKYSTGKFSESPFVLYEKYSRRDVSFLMNCGKDLSSTMYGMYRKEDDLFIFVTYHKEDAKEGQEYAEGKPDYADAFEDNLIFKWDSQIGKGNDSPYMKNVMSAPRKHLFVKKSDNETNFYYMGQFDIIESVDSMKKNNKGKMSAIAKVKMKMHQAVRDDILRYLQSNISKETAK